MTGRNSQQIKSLIRIQTRSLTRSFHTKTLRRLAAVVLLLTSPSMASEPPRFRLALVAIAPAQTKLPQFRGLNDGLDEGGYIEGKNTVIHRLQEESSERVRDRLTRTVRQGIDVIVTASAKSTMLARQITNKIPIVFAPSLDPVRMGFVKSRSHPGSNLTGLSFNRDVEDNAKQLAVFSQVVPTMGRAIIFYDGRAPYDATHKAFEAINRTARDLGIEIVGKEVHSRAETAKLLDGLPTNRGDGVFVVCTSLFRIIKPLADVAMRKRLPLFGCTVSHVADQGATMTYAPDLYFIGYRAAWYVDRILKGAAPGQLPVETPSRMQLIINVQNAQSLGLKIPSEQLILADKVFR